jgi:hypothetical protein
MTREDIIQMAQKAGFVWLGEYHSNLEDFAKLVAQHERKRIKQANAPEIERINAYIKETLAQPEQHQDWCASLTQMLMSMPPKPAPCNCKPKPEQEPVAWEQFYPDMGKPKLAYLSPTESSENACFTPPQRTWVKLTDEETVAIELGLRIPTGYRDAYDLSLRDFAKAIEAKLRSKNT